MAISDLVLNAGQVVLASPLLNFYQIRPLFTLEAVPEVIDATVMGGVAGESFGVHTQPTYHVGCTVLYAYRADYLEQQSVAQAIILGGISLNHSVADRRLQSVLNGSVGVWNSALYDTLRTLLQRTIFIRDFSDNGFADTRAGEYSIHGKAAGALIGDDRFLLRAGQSSIYGSTLDRRLAITSLLRTDSTIGSESDISIIGKSLLYTEKHAGNPLDAYGNGYIETGDIVTPVDDWSPSYRTLKQFGDILHGDEEFVLTADGTAAITKDRRTYSGFRSIQTAGGFSLERTPGISMYLYTGKRFGQYTESSVESEQAAYDALQSSDNWLDATFKDVWEETFKQVDADAAEREVSWLEITDSKFGKVYTSKGKAGIYGLPDGGIIIRDAFGSEILMSGGNIQIFAANNITTIASRDCISIVSGVYAVSADSGIVIGTNKKLSLFGKESIAVTSDKRISLDSAEDLNLVATNSVKLAGLNVSVGSETIEGSTGSLLLYSKGGAVLVGGSTVVVHGESAAQFSTAQSAVCLNGTSVVIGATQLQCTGRLVLEAKPMTITRPLVDKAMLKTVTIQSAGKASFSCEGDMIVGQTLKCNASIVASAAVIAKAIAGVTVTESKKLASDAGLKKSPLYTGFASTVASSITAVLQKAASLLATLSGKLTRATTFDIESKAYMFREPEWSAKTTDGITVSPVTRIENGNKTTYIYPGERFWQKEGMRVYTDAVPTPDTVYTVKGAGALRVSKTNSESRG